MTVDLNALPEPKDRQLDRTMSLGQGSLGFEVALIQAMLQDIGYGLRVDGDFGPLTVQAVVRFQNYCKLSHRNGVMKGVTVDALNSHHEDWVNGKTELSGPTEEQVAFWQDREREAFEAERDRIERTGRFYE